MKELLAKEGKTTINAINNMTEALINKLNEVFQHKDKPKETSENATTADHMETDDTSIMDDIDKVDPATQIE